MNSPFKCKKGKNLWIKQTGLEEGKGAGSRGGQVRFDLRVPAEVDYTRRHQLQILEQILVKGSVHVFASTGLYFGSQQKLTMTTLAGIS